MLSQVGSSQVGSRVACFTSLTCRYLPRARVLAQTLRAAHPDWHLCAVLVDAPPPGIDLALPLATFDAVVDPRMLGLPGFAAWMFGHDVVEACTAVKGAMLLRLLDAGWDRVVYLDPDIAVFHGLHEIVARLDAASVVLTPHQTTPNATSTAIGDNEGASLRLGVFNLGFLAVGNDAVGWQFARWWAGMLAAACYDEPEHGLFVDQKYCDLVPGLFDRVHVERDPGANVASWNISQRRIAITEAGDILARGSPLKFFHFSKCGGDGEAMTERYAGSNFEVFELWSWYRRQLAANAVAGLPSGWWHYGRFADGATVPMAARRLYRGRDDLIAAFGDPFASGPGSLQEWLAHEAPQVFDAAL